MKRSRTIDLTICAAIALLVGFALAPALARMQRSPAEAKCQSNLRRWAQAMSAYLADNHLVYPTNRRYAGGVNGPVSRTVQLSTDGALDQNGQQIRFQYGINWVEALYPYVQTAAAKTSQDWKSFRQCPNALDVAEPPAGALARTARMTYSFNYNLVEQHTGIVRDPGILMMFREMDRRVNSLLRPINPSMDSTSMPMYAFLIPTPDDSFLMPPPVDPNRHGSGSYICFADGHTKYFTTDFYPMVPVWEADYRRWYNFVSGPRAMTIGISP